MTDSYSQYDSIKENYPYKIDKVNLQAKAQQSFTDFYKKSMLDSVARYNTISKYEMFEDFVLKEISNKM